jgi:predicted MPP superfamily phosphohydrolase
MLALLFYILFLCSLLHLFFFVYNRYLLCLRDGPLKEPIHYLWFTVTVPLPAILILVLYNTEPVSQALWWRPSTPESKLLFSVMIALVAFFAARVILWIPDRFAPEEPANLIEETLSRPPMPAVSSQLPRAIRRFDTTGDLVLTEREIAVPGLAPAFDGFTIAQVSDIHFGQRVEIENYLLAVRDFVNTLDADIVCFTGDFVDRRRDIQQAVEFHAGFKARIGLLCVLGNHDYWTRADRVLECLAETPIHWLGNGERRILKREGRRLIFTGTDYPWDSARRDWRRAIRRDTGDAVVFLTHTPDNAPAAAREGASLILAGHNHGGQFCLPIIGPFVVPSRYGLKFAGGIYRVGGESVLNVSRGVGVSSGGARVLCRPEICLLTLRAPVVEAMAGKVIDARELLHKVEDEKAGGGVLAN